MTHLYEHGHTLIPATFLERPHRFCTVCRLQETGERVESHLADPGRLEGILEPGARLYVRGPYGKPRKLPYSTVMAEVDGVGINLVAAAANAIFPRLLEAGLFPELSEPGDLHGLDREVTMGESRVDFVVEADGRKVVVEVKAMDLSVEGRAMWPDAPSSRGRKHLALLRQLARDGQEAAMVFIAGRGDVEGFSPAAHVDPEFAEALAEASEEGVMVLAAKVTFDTVGARDPERLEVDLSVEAQSEGEG